MILLNIGVKNTRRGEKGRGGRKMVEKEEEGWLKEILVYSWDVVVEGVAKERKKMLEKKWDENKKKEEWEIRNRTKIKSLKEGLQQFENAEDAVLHFVKHAEYYLPRSDFNITLDKLLEKVAWIREGSKEAEEIRKQVQYLVGYIAWSLDAFENILNLSKSEDEVEKRVRKMINVEFTLAEAGEEEKKRIEDGLMEWKRGVENSENKRKKRR